MRHSPLVVAALCLAVLSLSGCALPGERQPPPVSAAQFQTRIAELETTLSQRCASAWQTRAEQQSRRDQALTTQVQGLGAQLDQLRHALQRLERDASVPEVRGQCPDSQVRLDNKEILGRTEWIGLPSVGTYLEARIDSGATTSSLSATEITRFERDGEDWVRFKLGLNADDSAVDAVRDAWIEAPVERRVRIIQASGEDARPVISLLMTLGPLRESVQFTLNDRTHLDHPVLLGRRFLMDIAVIDVAERFRFARPTFPGGDSADDAGSDEISARDAAE